MNPWWSRLLATALAAASSTNNGSSSSSSNSPWSPSEWRIQLDLGREPGTDMPDAWAASGARLGLAFDARVESETVPLTTNNERDFVGGNQCYRLTVLEDATFVNQRGQVTVRLGDTGGWKIATRRTGRAGDAEILRFWLDLVDSATRNDVRLDAGERLFCTANCWRAPGELERGRQRIRPLLQKYREAQDRIDQRLPHETGDRRLDGTNPVDTVMAYADMAVLVKNRDDRRNELREAERKLPSPQLDLSAPGRWPGSTEQLVVAPGKVVIQRRNAFGVEEFYIVGTWSAAPLEGVTEYYDDDEDDDEEEESTE